MSSTNTQPRALAAEALGAIGGGLAAAALIRALKDSTARLLDPTFREAEAVVVDRIASHLALARDPEVVEPLLDALRTRPASACAKALGELGDVRAIPLLVDSLREDSARNASMDALRRFRSAAIPRRRIEREILARAGSLRQTALRSAGGGRRSRENPGWPAGASH